MNQTQIASRLKLDFRSDTPIYIQIVDQVRQMIAAGILHPGDQLPTVRALAEALRINFNTVARAYRLLDEAGLISTQQGRGTYILEKPRPQAVTRLRQESLAALTRRFLREASRLGVTPQEALQEVRAQLQQWKENPATPEDR